jgi:hypothetical protein
VSKFGESERISEKLLQLLSSSESRRSASKNHFRNNRAIPESVTYSGIITFFSTSDLFQNNPVIPEKVTYSGITPKLPNNFPLPAIARPSLISKRRDATVTIRGSISVRIQAHTHRAGQSHEIKETQKRWRLYRQDFLPTSPVQDCSLHIWSRAPSTRTSFVKLEFYVPHVS